MFLGLKEFSSSIQSILRSKNQNIAIAADNDLDGLFSAILLDIGLYNLYEIETEVFFRDELRWEIPIDDNFDVLFLLDLAFDNTPNYRKIVSRAKNTYAIDHHITQETGFPGKVNLYNPCFEGQCYQPATFLVNRVITELGNDNNPLCQYLNLLGVLADAGINFRISKNEIKYSFDPSITLVYENGKKNFKDLFEVKQFGNYIYPHFKVVIEALNLEAADLGWNEMHLRFINEAENQAQAEQIVKKMEKKHEEAYKELLMKIPKQPTEISTESGIWIIKNTTSIGNGSLARVVAEMLDKPVIAYKCAKTCRVSARAPAESKINFIPIFENYGGGHPKACGAFLTPKRFSELFEKIKKA